jgi:predicted amidohydrolase YtcJ
VAFDAEAESLADRAQVREDFGDLPIFPGFHDARCHTTSFGLRLSDLDLSTPPVGSLEELCAAVKQHVGSFGPGECVNGSGYDQNKLGGHPELCRLDEALGAVDGQTRRRCRTRPGQGLCYARLDVPISSTRNTG